MSAKAFTIGGHTISYGGFLLREAGAGALTITKTVTGSGFDPAKTFELTVTFDKPVTYNGTTSTMHTFNLASGQSVTIPNIPEGTHYDVAETPLSAADIAAGYRIGAMSGGSGAITNGGSMSASASNLFEGAMLPAKTIRFRFSDASYDPSVSFVAGDDESFEWTRVSSSPNVWDCHFIRRYYYDDSWAWAFCGGSTYPYVDPLHFESYGLIEIAPGEYDYDPTKTITVVDANLTGVTSLAAAFQYCSQLVAIEKLRGTQDLEDLYNAFNRCVSLSSVPTFDISSVSSLQCAFGCTAIEHAPALDTSRVANFGEMFDGCSRLRDVPLYDTSSAVYVDYMFLDCYNVSSGALALYNQMANQAVPPSFHKECFEDCGRDTTTGAAELAQIPSGWK